MKYTLETERLLLRPFKETDARSMFDNWASDSEVSKYMTWNHHETIETTETIINMWIEQYQKPERINFGIVLKETNELIGGIDVCGYIDGIPVIGYALSRKYWNNGYMTEALLEVINLLKSLSYNKIKIDAAQENIGSNKVIQKCGGKLVNQKEQYFEQKRQKFTINEYIIELS